MGSERSYKQMGVEMLARVSKNPGPLENKAVKIKMNLPYYWLNEEENIILCGKIDWLEYLEDKDSVHVIDFKTGKSRESKESLQLPIYLLLVKNCQKRDVDKASYWYLRDEKGLLEKELPDEIGATEKVMKVAKRVKLARKLGKFDCKELDGCRYCRPLDDVVKGKGKLVGVSGYNQDIYVFESSGEDDVGGSEIL